VLVVLAASLSVTFRLVVDSVPGYRDRLQGLVALAAGHPTRIGSMALTWQRLEPSLDLRDVALLDEQGRPLLQLSRLRLGFSPGRLIQADWMPSSVDVYGLALEADVDALGHWSLRGLTTAGTPPDDGQLQRLASLDRVHLRDCRLLVHDPQLSRQPLAVGLGDALVRHTGQRYTLLAQLQPPPELAHSASLSATMQGDLVHPETWQGHGQLQIAGIQGWPWLSGVLAPGVRLSLQQAQAQLGATIQGGRITQIDVRADAGAASAMRGRDTLAHLGPLQLDLSAWPQPQSWRGEVRKLEMIGARGTANAQGRFDYALTPQGATLDAEADGLRLDDLAPWSSLLKELPAGAARLRDLRGDVHDLALHYEQAPGASGRYSLRARLAGIGLAADPAQSGFSGLDAQLRADQDGGHLQLQQASLQLQLPGVFEQPLPVASLSGDFAWQHGSAGWSIAAPVFDWKAVGSSGHGQVGLQLPAQDGAPTVLQLSADLAAEDVVALKPFMPKDWGPNTRAWLTRSLVHGRVAQGHILLDGPLPDYPFVEKPTGHWQLDLGLADGNVAFSPDWPAAEKVQAQLHFHGHGMDAIINSAQLAGNAIDQVEGQIPDFRHPLLTISGATHGDAARYYALLRGSPLRRRFDSLLSQTEASGPAAVNLHLEIPLEHDSPPTRTSGTARFDGATVKVRGLDPPVTGVHGSLAFDDDGVSGDGLSAQLYGAALSASIHPGPDSPDGVLEVQTDAPVQAADGVFAAYTPAWLRQRLGGSAHLTAHLPFSGPHAGQFSLSTDLRGLSSQLPPPAAKSADDSMPLTITLGSAGIGKTADAEALQVAIDGGDRFGLSLRFARAGRVAGETLPVRGVEVRLGPGPIPRADDDGVFVSGAPEVLDAAAWLDLIDAVDAAGSSDAPAGDSLPASPILVPAEGALAFRGFDLKPQQLVYHGAVVQQPHLLGAPAADGWTVSLDGADAEGNIDFSRANGGRLLARLQHLQLQPLAAASQTGEGGSGGTPFDPALAPVLDLGCDSLKLGAADLGRFTLLSSRTAGGQSLDQIKLEGGQLQTNTRGTWLRRNGSSYADLSFEFESTDLGTVLKAFGYADTMDARKASFSGTLSWPQQATGLELSQARGNVSLQVEKGTLRTVAPGAGRVLGLLNLYALPRRLIFDFHDVVSKGLGFDKLSGTFKLADGQAQTDDVQIVSPAMKMEMNGRIGLAARDYDQKITVHPDLSTEVIVTATLVNPIAGGVALLAQEVFNKPFNKLSQFSYHVTGSWDNPQVNAGDNKDAPKTDAAGGVVPAGTAAPTPAPAAPPAPAPAEPDADAADAPASGGAP
jgi:uncharacterized protein (TIGR02099 family)